LKTQKTTTVAKNKKAASKDAASVVKEVNSKTVPKQLKPFVKGDPRINRNGRPRSSKQIEDLIHALLALPAKDKNGKSVLVNGEQATEAEAMLIDMARNPKNRQTLLEYGYGKVKEKIDMSVTEKAEVRIVTERIHVKAKDAD
jgi:hypothetical protein